MAVCNNFTHEIEEFEAYNWEMDNMMKYELCQKNPGHEKFISVSDLKMEDVPPEFQTNEWMDIIQDRCNRTVKLRTTYISYDREGLTWYGGVPYPYSDKRYKGNTKIGRFATGFIDSIGMYKDKPCRCRECKNSTHPVIGHMEVWMYTARHVVFDNSETVHTTVELFYDTTDEKEFTLLDGCFSLWNSSRGPDNDRIRVYCFTHDKDVMDKLKSKIGLGNPKYSDRSEFKSGFIVSHPHGIHKQISFGQTVFFIYYFRKNRFPEHEGFVRCRLKLPRIKLLFSKLSKIFRKKENKMLENVTSPSMVEPGVEYYLPDTSKICVSGDYHGDRYLYDWKYRERWHKIPESVGYTDSNGKCVHFPPGMEILCQLEYQSTLTYDIPTCPGSSGACVYNYGDGVSLFYPDCVHSGADKVLGNMGINVYVKQSTL